MHCHWFDISIRVTLGAFALAAVYFLFGQIYPRIYYGLGEAGEDALFNADSLTAYNLTDRKSNHYRTDHPVTRPADDRSMGSDYLPETKRSATALRRVGSDADRPIRSAREVSASRRSFTRLTGLP